MLTDDEILDLVRECDLDWHAGFSIGDEDNRYARLARAIEAALAATPQGEPVAWMVSDTDNRHFIFRMNKPAISEGETLTPLYAAPPATTCRVDDPGTVTVTATGVMFESSEKLDVRAAQPSAEPTNEVKAWLFTHIQSGDVESSTNPDWHEDAREFWHREPLCLSAAQPSADPSLIRAAAEAAYMRDHHEGGPIGSSDWDLYFAGWVDRANLGDQ